MQSDTLPPTGLHVRFNGIEPIRPDFGVGVGTVEQTIVELSRFVDQTEIGDDGVSELPNVDRVFVAYVGAEEAYSFVVSGGVHSFFSDGVFHEFPYGVDAVPLHDHVVQRLGVAP